MNRILLAAALALGVSLSASASDDGAELARSVTIYRDTYGVPHIYAKTDAGAAFGLMYAQAEDNFRQLEADYIHYIGRATEIDGPRALHGDILVHAYEVVKHAREEYRQADPSSRAICDAFAAGVNFYLKTHPEVHPRLIEHFEPWFLLALELDGPPGAGITKSDRERAFPALRGVPEPPPELPPNPNEGSNMWAVAPSHSATGHAMLMINPHVGFFGADQRYEAHLHSDEGLDVSGFAVMGTPYIRSGHNRFLGWSHTNNYARTYDVYVETFDDPADPLSYRYGAEHRKATEWSETLHVKTLNGIESWPVTFRKTHHGPVLGVRTGQGGAMEGFAVRYVGIDGGVLEQRWAMDKSRNLQEFQAALARTALTGSNTMYADHAGNIFYLHGNAIPKRLEKFDWTKPVDGSNPETEWQGKHAMADLPQVLNPPSGWLQNCNSSVFLTTSEGSPEKSKFPAYMAPEPDTARSQRSRAILGGTPKFSFEDWTRLALDTKMGLAATRVPELQAVYAKLRQADAARAAKLADLISVLAAWDQVGRNDSVASTLFVWMETRAIELRRSRSDDPYLLVSALENVKTRLESDFGTWRVAWGDVNRLQRVHTTVKEPEFRDDRPSVPVPGAPSFTGTIFTFGAKAVEGQKRWYGTVGDSYVAVVDFGSKVEARSLLVFGQIADPKSKHFFDQAELYSTQKFKPAWFDLGDVKKHLERSYRPGEK